MKKNKKENLIPPSSVKGEDKKQELILRQMETLGKLGHWEVDFVNQTLHWSEGVFRILEMDPSSMPVDLEKGYLFVHPEDRELATLHMNEVLEKGISYDLECRLVTTTGKVKFVHSRAEVVRNEKNEPMQIVGIFQDVTEQREAYYKLKQQEMRLSTILQSEPECVKVVSPDGVLIEMNPAGLNMIEADCPEDAIGQKIESLIFPADLKFYRSLHQNALKGIKSSARFRIIGMKGTERWMESTAVPLTNQFGEVNSVLSVTRDISEKVINEEKLIRIKRNQEALINGTSDLIWSIDANFRLVAANQSFLSLLSFLQQATAKEGDSVLVKTIGEDFYLKWKGYYERGLSGESFTSYENFISPITKLEEHKEVYFNPIQNAEGQITGLACFSKDITDLMTKRMELVASEKRYRALVENGIDVIAILTTEGKAKYVSPSVTKVLGYSEADAMHMNIFDFLHPDDIPKIRKRLEEVCKIPIGNSLPSHNFRIKHLDGTWRWVESTITNLIEDESIGGIVDNFHDITERKTQIDAIQIQNQKLRDIAWTQSHVVRSPLATIMGLVELIRTGSLTKEEEYKTLQYLLESANELDQVIGAIVRKSQEVILPEFNSKS
ncbi:PAS domain-containing protein [Leptospira bandrabouensis]|uniref:histidine kinase n=1 Tax=Leptospira bandrabouensis TaxID=2484903 RepID=A0A6H3NY20_9LEPT|nr:PAS domain S-box protein [Leptospira bandrabouensis]TGN05721.1 PAS domain S-box protein [Leptospira bandrabouensis]TGN16053.1 PAS domain S-box protein [Leptospira bandrabouensis]